MTRYLVALLMLAGLATSTTGQETRPDPANEPAPEAPDAPAASPLADEPAPRPPLLREGSVLRRVPGIVQRDGPDEPWQFLVSAADLAPDRWSYSNEPAPIYELTLMPCRLLTEISRIAEFALESDDGVAFEMTGVVYLFEDRNYFLPTLAPQVISRAEASTPDPPPAAAEPESADAIKAALRRAAGDIRRSPGAAPDEPETEAPEDLDAIGAEGRTLTQRRGRLVREPTGAWIFTLQAPSPEEQAEPLVVLPCQLLERMADRSRSRGFRLDLVLSGRIHHYRDARFLLPTMFVIPRNDTPLDPNRG